MDIFDSMHTASIEYFPSAIISMGSVPLSIKGEGPGERVLQTSEAMAISRIQKNTQSNYKGPKGNVCARTGASGSRKSLWAGEIIALKFSEIVDFRATIARADAQEGVRSKGSE